MERRVLMLKAILLPVLAVFGGLGGFFLRRWELSSAFEASGLAIPWAPASLLLVGLSAVLALVFALLCRGSVNKLTTYADAFSSSANWVYLIVAALAAAHLLIAGVSGVIGDLNGGDPGLLRMLLWIACILTFPCVVLTALTNFHAKGRQYSLLLLVPAYMCCLWLVVAYQRRDADPVVLAYVYEMLAIICALLGFYFQAGFSFERAKVWRCAFFCLMSVYFSMVTLADGHDMVFLLLFLFSILYQLASVTVLLRRAFCPIPKRLKTENNSIQEVIPDEQ